MRAERIEMRGWLKTAASGIFLMLPYFALGQDIDVRLQSIRYQDGCNCTSENPIQVRVNFVTDFDTPADLTVVIKSSENVTYNAKLKEFDGNGNICYTFCSKLGEASNFDIYFRNGDGLRSQVFNITAVPKADRISNNQNNETK